MFLRASLFISMLMMNQALAVTTTVIGPDKISPSIRGPVQKVATYNAQKAGTETAITVTVGSGKNISIEKCAGKLVEVLKCQVSNAVKNLEVLITRPKTLELTLNGQALVDSKKYDAYLGRYAFKASSNLTNEFKIKVSGIDTASATYTVQLESSNDTLPPVPVITASPENGVAPVSIVFSGIMSSSQGGPIVGYVWDFGDGTSAEGSIVTHTYLTGGNFAAQLTVKDSAGKTSTTSRNIAVTQNIPPQAGFEFSVSGKNVSLDASSSKDSDGSIVSYDWNFGDGSTASGKNQTHTYSNGGTYNIQLTVKDDKGASSSSSKSVSVIGASAPVAKISLKSQASGFAPLVVWLDGSNSSDSSNLQLTYAWDFGDGEKSQLPGPLTHEFKLAGTYSVKLTVTNSAGLSNSTQTNIVVTTPSIPVEPSIVAPPLAQTASTSINDSVAFLYNGSNPIQTGVVPEYIDPARAAVVSGKILDDSGNPISGVKVSIHKDASYGQTVTRNNGNYDLVVNGGGEIVVNFERNGYLPSQRKLKPGVQNFSNLPEVILVQRDPKVTEVKLGTQTSGIVLAKGSTVTDSSGTRTAVMAIPAKATAKLLKADGSATQATSLSLRATEYTVGGNGPKKMPGALPRTSGYMYAVELSADEGTAIGAEHVQFSEPVSVYVDNFLGFSPGVKIPNGTYSFERAQWEPQENGLVIKVLSKQGSDVSLDISGKNQAATPAELTAIGINSDELTTIGSLYGVGASFWRMRTDHFSPGDYNAGFRTITSAGNPGGPPVTSNGPSDGGSCQKGSIIDVDRQVLGEEVAIVGTDLILNYSSSRAVGRLADRTTWIPITDSTSPNGLLGVDLKVEIAGKVITESFGGSGNQMKQFVWDGYDSYGRFVQGSQTAKITTTFKFPQTYTDAGANTTAFGRLLTNTVDTRVPAREPARYEKTQEVRLGAYNNYNEIGGWNFSVHHFYDVANRTLYYGNGTNENSQGEVGKDNKYLLKFYGGSEEPGFEGDGGHVSSAKFNTPVSPLVGSDGSLYVIDSGNARIRKVSPSGIVSTVVGNGIIGSRGDGGYAQDAEINVSNMSSMTEDSNGSLYFTDTLNHKIRKVSRDGIITTVAGTGSAGISADNVVALQAQLNTPLGLAIDEGTIYFADSANDLVRAIDPTGRLYTVYGNRTSARLVGPRDIKLGNNREIYVSYPGTNHVDIIEASGSASSFSNKNFFGPSGSYYYNTVPFQRPTYVKVLQDGKVFFVNSLTNDIWVSAGAKAQDIKYFAGNNDSKGENVFPIAADFGSLTGMDIALDGSMFLTDGNRIKIIESPLPRFTGNDLEITSKDASEIYVFSKEGRHLKTLNTMTGTPIWSFEYNGQGLLISVSDRDGKKTQLQRDNSGRVQKIIAPFGQETVLNHNNEGYLASLTPPGVSAYSFEYASGGLLSKFTKPNGGASTFAYDNLGQLIRDTDAKGGFKELLKSINTGASQVVSTSTTGSTLTAHSVRTNYGDETVVRTQSGDAATAVRSIDNYVFSQSPYYRISELRKPDPHFGGLSSYSQSRSVDIGGSTYNAIEYTDVDPTDKFKYVKKHTFTIPFTAGTYNRTYDSKSRTETVTSQLGYKTTTVYDSKARAISIKEADFPEMNNQYNTLGQLIKSTHGDREVSFTYNQRGLLASVENSFGDATSFEYDGASRKIAKVSPDGARTTYRYDSNGNLLGITPPGKTEHLFSFDILDLISDYISPKVDRVETKTVYSYDSEKRIKQVVRPDGRKITYVYNDAGKLIRLEAPEGQTTFSFDATTGLPSGFSSPDGLLTSISGRIINLSYSVSGPIGFNYTIYESPIGGRQQASYYHINSNANNVSWSYNPDGRKSGEGGSLHYFRKQGNQLVEQINQGLTYINYKYNAYGEVTSIESNKYSEAPFFREDYTRDKTGRIIGKTTAVGGSVKSISYEYDKRGRLVRTFVGGVLSSIYEYDSNGNRVSMTKGTKTERSTFDSQDRLIASDEKTFSYSKNGEVQSVKSPGNTIEYAHDSFGMLKRSVVNGKTVEYLDDAMNRRTVRKVNGEVKQGFVYSNENQVIGELDQAGQLVSLFKYGVKNSSPEAMTKGGKSYLIIGDSIGSVRMVVDAYEGTVVQELEYDDFGSVIKDTNPGFQPFGFAGGIYDQDTKLVKFGARDYDPEFGRWTSKDPILFNGGDTNLYGYTFQDPINFIDPSGLITCAEGVSLVGAMGGAVVGGVFGSPILGVGGVLGAMEGASIGALGGYVFASMACPKVAEAKPKPTCDPKIQCCE